MDLQSIFDFVGNVLQGRTDVWETPAGCCKAGETNKEIQARTSRVQVSKDIYCLMFSFIGVLYGGKMEQRYQLLLACILLIILNVNIVLPT